ncbi:uncharacterized protein BO80DRAFT_342702, partial [Aspergillus ibericus CBS 121593]
IPTADTMRAYQLVSAACVRREDHPHPFGSWSHRRTQPRSTAAMCSHDAIGVFSADVVA